MNFSTILGHSLLPALLLSAASAAPAADDHAARLDFFEKKVRPILVSRCYTCHSAATKPSGGLRVDDRNGLLTGGGTGPAVVPGKPEASLLMKRITETNAGKRMPKETDKLAEEEIATLGQWIKDGAVWPPVELPASFGQARHRYEKLRKQHWAWQPIQDPAVPAVKDSAWPRDAIDRFILATLEDKRLAPVADADRVTLIRRVTFDLTGLPPTLSDIDAFLADHAPQAFERVVDRLLASPAFGERWGRHWLDIARYGESTGPSRNIPYPYAWRYRNYVIDSFTRDKPFDRFLREQLAGDLLPASSPNERDQLLTATGFLALGVKDVNQRFKVRFVMDNVDEQIDVVSRSILGLTVSCARCHDHKFDPIPTTDYYALAGIFTSTDNCAGVCNKMGGGGLAYYVPSMLVALTTDLPRPPAARVAKMTEQVAEAKSEWDAVRDTPEGRARGSNGQPKQRELQQKYERLRFELLALTDPAARGHAVHGVRDARAIGDTEVRVRGLAEQLGPTAPRGFLSAFEVPDAPKVNSTSSGRLELADWMIHPNNPLTTRVFVNRAWQHLFGAGLVQTVDNFGTTGDTPSHPELLDHLATRFVHDGWSVKKLVRTLVLTRAYQLGSDATEMHRKIDPANRLVWRHSPRRLEAEEMRDAMLHASGALNLTRPVGSVVQTMKMMELADNSAEASRIREFADRSVHRSVYLPLIRGVTPSALEAFDPVEQTLVTGKRDATTVPGQALYLLNSPFVRKQAKTLAERLLADKASDADRIQKAYRRVLGRAPSAAETERGRAFLAEYESATASKGPPLKDTRTDVWTSLIQALFASAEFRFVR
jgi:cytochrome c553